MAGILVELPGGYRPARRRVNKSRKVDESGTDPMTMFEQPVLPEETTEQPIGEPPKRPSRWSTSNWPVRWKVLAIVVIPLALALLFAGLRISDNVTDARDLRLVADRANM